MQNETYKIYLTKSQVEILIEFFEINFIDDIRNDEGIDNIDYICDMCNVYQELKKCVRGTDNAE